MSEPGVHRHAFKAMGSPCELRLYSSRARDAQRAATAAQQAIGKLEQRYTRYQKQSLTSRINAAAGTAQAIAVDEETASLLDYAAQAFEQSGGLFDITSGVLRRAWDFRVGRIPAQAAIDAVLPLIGWEKVEWRRPQLRLPQAGMELDFGGFVKEYAADVAVRACREAGIERGLVELGGDIGVIGPHPDGSPWRVGVSHPRVDGAALAYVDLASGAIASSGDYERYFEAEGRRYCHILNPKTGWPVTALAAVSVLAPACLLAGTASTIAMLKETEGEAWLSELGLPHLVATRTLRLSGSLLRM